MAKSRKHRRGGSEFNDESTSSSSSRSSKGGRRRHKRGGLAAPAPMKPMAPAPMKPTAPAMPSVKAPALPAAIKAPTLPGHPLVKALAASKGGRRRRRGSRSRRGGDGGADWVLKNFGNGNQQWDNTFTNSGTAQSGNLLPTIPGAPAVSANNLPQSSNASYIKGGRRSRSKRGGYWAQVLNQALVPFVLVGLQNKFSKRHRK